MTPLTETASDDTTPEPPKDVAIPKTKSTRSRKAVEENTARDVEEKAVAAPRRTRAAASATESQTVPPKTRGRSKKTVLPEEQTSGKQLRTTRTRAASNASTTTDKELPKVTAGRKKVTFQDVASSDKENISAASSKKGTKPVAKSASTTIKAKPVKKAGTARTRSTRSMTETEDAPKPLSPKKPAQIAKALPVDSDDDELNGGKTPIRPLNKSPMKQPETIRVSPAKKLNFEDTNAQPSPLKTTLSSVMLSPAKRPPPSPFKDALKESPRKAESGFVFPNSPSKYNNLGSKSPEKVKSTLCQSPRRGQLNASVFMGSAFKTQTHAKASLLQSPAKRLFSPVKTLRNDASPKREIFAKTPAKSPELTEDPFSPDFAVSCNFRSSSSPEKVTLADDLVIPSKDITGAIVDFDESILDIRSPIKLPVDKTSDDEQALDTQSMEDSDEACNGLRDVHEEPQESDEIEAAHPLVCEESVLAKKSQTNSTEQNTPTVAKLSSHLYQHSREQVDDSSEDELQMDETPVRRFPPPTKTPAARNVARSRLSTINPGETSREIAFTPLATQLSNWFAASPESTEKDKKGEKSIFSIPTPVQQAEEVYQPIVSHGVSDKKALNSVGLRKSYSASVSLALSMSETPTKLSFFDDEMAVRDLEEELISVHENNANVSDAVEELSEQASNSAIEGLEDDTIMQEENEGVSLLNLDGYTEVFEEEAEHMESETIAEATVECHLQEDGPNYINEGQPLGIGEVSVSKIEPENPTVQNVGENLPEVKGKVQDSEQLSFDESTAVHDFGLPSDAQDSVDRAEEPTSEDTMTEKDQPSFYGDENKPIAGASGAHASMPAEIQAKPIPEPQLSPHSQIRMPLVSISTPIRPNANTNRFVKTVVSKVPLRGEGQDSSLQVPKKRSRSLSVGPSSSRKTSPLAVFSLPKSSSLDSVHPEEEHVERFENLEDSENLPINNESRPRVEVHEDIEDPEVFERFVASASSSPSRSPRRNLEAGGILTGAVVYIDVHTTEGADASGIFTELLTEMGAKCVKTWSWNPRASINVNGNDDNASSHRKIGITHVVYKDGGKRTLEKVRNAAGVVKCVGVGWVLDCERENKWLDEASYAVDTSVFPRGGSRRRKSMEPKTLMNSHGNLFETRRSTSGEMAPANGQSILAADDHDADESMERRDSLDIDASGLSGSPSSTFSTPTAVHNVEFGASISSYAAAVPATPTGHVSYDPSAASPMTPYYLSQGAALVQHTCPPKQTQQGLFFPVSGEISEETDERVRRRLEQARRKTLGWRPRVSSPLGR